MKISNDLIMEAVSMGASANSDIINCNNLLIGSIQMVWTGSPVGDFTVQASNDFGNDSLGAGVTNWSTLSGSTVAAGGGAGSHLYTFADLSWRWMRLVYTRTSGTGSVSARSNMKGI